MMNDDTMIVTNDNDGNNGYNKGTYNDSSYN